MALAQCQPGSRLACDEAELDGLGPTAAGGALPLPALPVAMLALAVPLLLGILSGLIRRKRAGQRTQHAAPGPRGRRLAVPATPTAEAAQQAAPAAPLPPHPAAVGAPGAVQQRSPAAAALLTATDAAASFLLLPVSMLQTAKHALLGPRAGTAAPSTPETAAMPGSQQRGGGSGSGRRTVHYGLGYGEAESEEDEWEGGESELTCAALRQLQQSPQFQGYLRDRGLTAADVGSSTRKLRLYRRLRRLDPDAFLALLRPGSRSAFETQAASRLVLVVEHLLSTAVSLAIAAALYHVGWAWAGALPAGVRGVAAAVLLWLLSRQWLRARPTAGPLFGLYYEELEWGHGAPGWRCLTAGALELLYVLGSAGAGVPVSLVLRCSGRRQSVGELLAGVRAVREVQSTAPLDG